MANSNLKKQFEEVFSKYNRSDLQCKLNTLIFFLKKANINELTEITNSINKDSIINIILETDKEVLRKQNINVSEIRRRLAESDFIKIQKIFDPKGDMVVAKLKQLLNW